MATVRPLGGACTNEGLWNVNFVSFKAHLTACMQNTLKSGSVTVIDIFAYFYYLLLYWWRLFVSNFLKEMKYNLYNYLHISQIILLVTVFFYHFDFSTNNQNFVLCLFFKVFPTHISLLFYSSSLNWYIKFFALRKKLLKEVYWPNWIFIIWLYHTLCF